MKKAILLVNLGTPDAPDYFSVRRYLTEFLNDKRVIDIPWLARSLLVNLRIAPFRSRNSAKIYKEVWTPEGSPLLIYGVQLKDKLQKALGDKYIVELAMRYQSPSMKSVLEKLRTQRPSEIIVLPLYPQYASSSTGSTIEEFCEQIKGWEVIPSFSVISKFYDRPEFVDALVATAKKYDISAYDHVLFSYHGLPERQIHKASAHYGGNTCQLGSCCNSITKNNQYCYRANSFETTRHLVKALNIPEGKYTSAFQSRLNDKWLKPFSDKVVEELAKKGVKKLLVFSPAFVADCLETTYEVGTEYDEIFRHHGGEKVTLVESLNANDVWVEALTKMLQ